MRLKNHLFANWKQQKTFPSKKFSFFFRKKSHSVENYKVSSMLAKQFVQKFKYRENFVNLEHPLNETQFTSEPFECFDGCTMLNQKCGM